MASTITQGDTTITPALVLGYDSSRTSGNIVHWILGRPDPDITLRPARLRNGTLKLLFRTEAAAAACLSLHSGTGVFTLADPDVSSVGMRYAVDGSIDISLDPQTLEMWVVSVAYQEIAS
jgi:hypothetical protein